VPGSCAAVTMRSRTDVRSPGLTPAGSSREEPALKRRWSGVDLQTESIVTHSRVNRTRDFSDSHLAMLLPWDLPG
jgi:hypothetical protein